MGMQSNKASFGLKGASDKPVTLAQSLLTGKPLSHVQVQDRIPKLKPRVKPRFGRREDLEQASYAPALSQTPATGKARNKWALWLAMVVTMVLGL